MNHSSMTPTTNKPSSPNQSIQQRRLARQRMLRYPNDQEGETFHSTVAVTISLPASPRRSSSYSRSSSPVFPQPLPLPLPESPLTRRPDNLATLPTSRLLISKDTRKHSHDHLDEAISNLKMQFTATSTPTSIFSSPITSSGRLSSGNLSDPAINFPRDFNDISRLPAKTSHSSGNHSPKQHNTIQGGSHSHHSKIYSRVSSENNRADAHPLPLPPPTRALPRPQQPMKSQWQKGKLIGRGSFGNVYHATNLETGASCAMKEVYLFPEDPKSDDYLKQLSQEIGTLGLLHHPNVMQYYGSELVGDQLCMYMEYVNPGSLLKFMQEHNGTLTEPVVRNFTRHILSGLAYLHSTETIHMDIKVANLLVDPSGIVKLADFGVSKTMTEKSYELSLKRSPYWMSPELMMATFMKKTDPDVTTAVDIWSLGCTVIEMLTGKSPWSEFSGNQVVFKALNRSPDIPETLSPEGQDFLEQCFQRNPANRPSAAVLLTHAFVQNLHEQDAIVQSLGSHKEQTLLKDESRKHDPGNSSKVSPGVAPAFFRARIFRKIQNLIGGTGIRSKQALDRTTSMF